MTLLAVPNVSEGRDAGIISALQEAVTRVGSRLLDTHSDPVHNRTVLTVSGAPENLIAAMVELTLTATELISLSAHEGVHPRVGVVDVCPFVPHHSPIEAAESAARATGRRIGEAGVPVFLYGSEGTPPLPAVRRGGLEGLVESIAAGRTPDFGPPTIDPDIGVVCVGARGPLIAFNVNIAGGVEDARKIAGSVRAGNGGPPGLRALGLPMPDGAQVSMNITRPDLAGIVEAFTAVEVVAGMLGVEIVSTELVGLVEERFLPSPDAKAARLLVEPGRSVESVLKG